MQPIKTIGKREFIQNTSKYLHWVEDHASSIIITHRHEPDLILSKIKPNTIKGLRGAIDIKVHGDINEPILTGYDEWLS